MNTAAPEADTLALTGLDRALVAFLQEVQPGADPLHGELAARVSHQFGQGHACLDLDTLALPLRQSAASLPWIEGPNSPLVLLEPQRSALPGTPITAPAGTSNRRF